MVIIEPVEMPVCGGFPQTGGVSEIESTFEP